MTSGISQVFNHLRSGMASDTAHTMMQVIPPWLKILSVLRHSWSTSNDFDAIMAVLAHLHDASSRLRTAATTSTSAIW